jgi:hypothetical protein
MKKGRKSKIPFVVVCQCGHRLVTENYIPISSWPSQSVPPEKIHQTWNPNVPMYCVQCSTCGHYTMNKPLIDKSN